MKIFKWLVLLIVLTVFPALTGNSAIKAQDKDWRPVTPADLAMKPTVEPDADAEALFWEVRLDDSSSSELAYNHYVRVKIFTERGRERFSKFDIPFFKGKKVKDIAARVVKPDGTIIGLKKEEIFEREIIKSNGLKIKAKSFAVPGIEPGVIFEYRYRETFSNDGLDGEKLIFQRDIPVQKMSYYLKPFEGQVIRYDPYNMPQMKFVKEKGGFFVGTLTNVPAFKEEPRMPPEDQARMWTMLTVGGGSSIFNWAVFSSKVAPSFIDAMKPRGEVKNLLPVVIAGATSSEEEKLRKIYDYCQKELKNVTFDPKIPDEEKEKISKQIKDAGDMAKRKIGARQDVNLLFASLASAAGFDVRLAFSGDRSEFFFDPAKNIGLSFIHNSGIGVKVGERWRFFDPGSPYLPFGMLDWYEEDVHAMLIGEKGFIWFKTPLTDYNDSKAKRTGRFKLLEDGTLEGKVKIEYTGHRAISRRRSGFEDEPTKREDDLKNEIKAQISNAEVSDIRIENFDENSKPLIHSYTLKIPNYAQKTGRRLFFQPNVFEFGAKSEFSATTRVHPIYFNYPFSDNDDVEISLPAGFTLESPDAPGLIADPSNISSLDIKISVSREQDLIVYNRKFHFGGGGNILFPKESYPAIKNLFDAFHKADMHSLTLRQGSGSGTGSGNPPPPAKAKPNN